MFIVRARFTLADGARMLGHLTPPVRGDTDLAILQPAIVVDRGQVPFWRGILAPEPAQVAASYALLGQSQSSDVVPLKFESDVALVGGPVVGELPGSLVLDDFKTMQTRIIK